MKNLSGVLILLLALSVATPVFAHAHLEKADPAAGAMPIAPVGHVDLYYSEALEPDFSKATLADKDGKSIAATSSVDAANAKHIIVTPAIPLGAGAYKLTWHVVSIDTHKTQGSFKFMVKP